MITNDVQGCQIEKYSLSAPAAEYRFIDVISGHPGQGGEVWVICGVF
jgi:hypothetical protein